MDKYLIGGLVVSLLINVWTIYLLFKKPTTHNEIDRMKQVTKRNKNSNIENDISPQLNSEGLETPKKQGVFKRMRNKRLIKKAQK